MSHNADPVKGPVRAAGSGSAAPEDRARRVEAAVRVEWECAVQKRVGRRRAAWIATGCLTSAALIALALHAHVSRVDPQVAASPVSVQRPAHASDRISSRERGSYLRANDDDGPTDRGLPRRLLASYTVETR
jgi:hypothetical protein